MQSPQVTITPTLCFMIWDQLLSTFLKPVIVTSVVNASQRSHCDLEWFLGNREALALLFIFRFFTFYTNTGDWRLRFPGSDPGPGEAHQVREAGEEEALLVLEGGQGQGRGGSGGQGHRGGGGGGGARLGLRGRRRDIVSLGETYQTFASEQGIVIGFQVSATF